MVSLATTAPLGSWLNPGKQVARPTGYISGSINKGHRLRPGNEEGLGT